MTYDELTDKEAIDALRVCMKWGVGFTMENDLIGDISLKTNTSELDSNEKSAFIDELESYLSKF
jgi:hypothetical protein